ncbi:MAG: hypothetical protein OEW60_06780, partial [Thiovulaceae bacterium]|nr:hypothetical protein [Sulfurimonadaceae bacterium]
IKPSTIMYNAVTNTFQSLESATGPVGLRYAVEWIAYDNDSRRGIATQWNQSYINPAWSGLIDLQDSNATTITDPIMLTTELNGIIAALSYGDLNLTQNNGNNTAVIIYPNAAGSVEDYGWYGNSAKLVHPIKLSATNKYLPASTALNTFKGFDNEVYEHYFLSHSAYAIEYNDNDKSLQLFYNYQPWNGEVYSDGNSTLLAENVTTFQLLQIGTLIKIQLCLGLSQWELRANDSNYSICKEQAVY